MVAMPMKRSVVLVILLAACRPGAVAPTSPVVAVGPQYDTTHVYVAPEDVDRFASSFCGTFGGQSTKQVVATVTPQPSKTTSQLLQTPVGTVSLFGFQTPIPVPFGTERNGYLVTDLAAAVAAARAAGADVIVEPFTDPIGRDAIVEWPGGARMQLYWHFKPSSYPAFQTIPDNRVYVSKDRADALVHAFVEFAHGTVVSDVTDAPGVEIGRPKDRYRRVHIASTFGRMLVLVTDGHLPYPYGAETTGYEVADLAQTLEAARANGATVVVEPSTGGERPSAMVRFPGGYVAEIHMP